MQCVFDLAANLQNTTCRFNICNVYFNRRIITHKQTTVTTPLSPHYIQCKFHEDGPKSRRLCVEGFNCGRVCVKHIIVALRRDPCWTNWRRGCVGGHWQTSDKGMMNVRHYLCRDSRVSALTTHRHVRPLTDSRSRGVIVVCFAFDRLPAVLFVSPLIRHHASKDAWHGCVCPGPAPYGVVVFSRRSGHLLNTNGRGG